MDILLDKHKVLLDPRFQASHLLGQGFRNSEGNLTISQLSKYGSVLSTEIKHIEQLNLSFRKKYVDVRKEVFLYTLKIIIFHHNCFSLVQIRSSINLTDMVRY